MTDTSETAAYSPGLLAPVAQAYANDPRRTLVEALMKQGQNAQQQRLYTPGATVASALTQALGPISGAFLASQYQDANKGAQDTLAKAIAEPDLNKRAQIEAGNQYLAPQALSTANQAATMKMQFINELAKTGRTIGPDGGIMAIPGAAGANAELNAGSAQGTATGTNLANSQPGPGGQAGVISATTPAEAAKAAAVASAQNPALIQRAVGTAAGTAPIDAFKTLFTPQVDRATGEIIIPGMDPETTKKVMGAFGVRPQDVTGASPAAAAPPGVVGSNLLAKPPAAAAPSPTQTPAAPQVTPVAPPQTTPQAAPPGVVGSNLLAKPPAAAAPAPAQTPAAPQVTPVAPPQTTPQASSSDVKPFNGGDPAKEVPSVKLPTGLLPAGPSTIVQGRDPITMKAGEEAVEGAQKQYGEVQDAAKAAKNNMADLNTLRTLIQNGQNTNALMPAKATLSAYLNATLGATAAKQITGVDPAQADVFNKDATRMGLTFARQTEGARESLQAIQIAVGANPSLATTKEGNQKIIDLMEAGAKHDLDQQSYENAFYQKNGHYVGAKEWFDQNHPPAEYTSKVMPYNLPTDPKTLQPNVTYNLPNHGPSKWTGQGFVPAGQ